jgi:hypothetical protein
MAQGVKEGSLHRVFGIFATAKDSLREPKDAIPMGHHKARKCGRITSPGASQQILFFACDQRRSHLSWSGLRNLALNDLKTCSGLRNLRDLAFC